VIFTERIQTQKFLQEHLKRDLGLTDKQIAILHGTGMSDIEQQKVVENFGKDNEPVRLLIASDVASEGINLHYLSHRMIHFDIPWSLMVFMQRNGRIDRYGQTEEPHRKPEQQDTGRHSHPGTSHSEGPAGRGEHRGPLHADGGVRY